MSLSTSWGYSLTGSITALPDIITVEEFNTYTANKYASDSRIASEIRAASLAVRNYCGWHLCPEAACSLSERLLYGNGRVKRVGHDLLVQLPSRCVTAVSSALINNTAFADFDFDNDGVVHVFDVPAMDRKSIVTVNYTAGLSDALLDSIKEIIVHRVKHSVSSSEGVTSETAGSMSVTYSAGWANSARASALPDDSKEALSMFKVQGVF